MATLSTAPSSSCGASGGLTKLAIGSGSVQSSIVATSTDVPARIAGIRQQFNTSSCTATGRNTLEIRKVLSTNIVTTSSSILSLVNTNAIASSETPAGQIVAAIYLDALYGASFLSGSLAVSRVSVPSGVISTGSVRPTSVPIIKQLVKKLVGSVTPTATSSSNKVTTQQLAKTGTVTASGSTSFEQLNKSVLDSFFYWLRHRRH